MSVRQAHKTTRRQPGLDAIRALAIALVLAAHSTLFIGYGPVGHNLASVCGTLGVELFFSLSGFLIGRILLDLERRPLAPGPVAIFLARRWLRTLPLYYVVLLLVAVLLQWPVGATDLLLVQGFRPATSWLMPQLCSLAVEELFYLAMPLLMAACGGGRGSAARAAGIALVLGWVLRLMMYFGTGAPPDLLEWFRSNPMLRIDACAPGVLAACWLGRGTWRPGRAARTGLLAGATLAILALAATELTMFLLPPPWRATIDVLVVLHHLGLLQALNFAAALAIAAIAAAPPANRPAWSRALWPRALWHRAGAVGADLAYGLYLVHLPIYAWFVAPPGALATLPAATRLAFAVAASFAAAVLLRVLVEAPVLAWRDRRLVPARRPAHPPAAHPAPGPTRPAPVT